MTAPQEPDITAHREAIVKRAGLDHMSTREAQDANIIIVDGVVVKNRYGPSDVTVAEAGIVTGPVGGLAKSELAAAFTEWERRWREEPSRFEADSERLAGTSEDYGTGAANYLLEILWEKRG